MALHTFKFFLLLVNQHVFSSSDMFVLKSVSNILSGTSESGKKLRLKIRKTVCMLYRLTINNTVFSTEAADKFLSWDYFREVSRIFGGLFDPNKNHFGPIKI